MRPWPFALSLMIAGCSPTPEEVHYIRAVVDTDLDSPMEIDSFTVAVESSGTTKFEQHYDSTTLTQLPDSLVIEEPDPVFVSPDNEYQLPRIRISVVGYANSTPVVWRSASFRYGNGRKQVPLPLCHDCLNKSCPSGETCRHGACVDDSITPESEEESGAMVNALLQCGPR